MVSVDLFVFYERLIDAGVVCMVTGSVGSSAYGAAKAGVEAAWRDCQERAGQE